MNQEIFENVNASSLKNIRGKNLDLQTCLAHLCSFIEVRYLQLINKNINSLKADYHQKLYRLNKKAKYQLSEGIVDGKIIGVTSQGKLLLEIPETTSCKELGMKEVKFI